MPRKPVEPKPNVIGIVGLDGGQDALSTGIARRLQRGGLSVVTYAPAPVSANLSRLADESGITLCESLRELVALLPAPRTVWLTLPAGLAIRLAMDALQPVLAAGDIVVNTADGHFNEALQYAAILARQGIHHIDAGIADGPWGESNGYTIMLGGDAAAVNDEKLATALTALAAADGKGWLHCGDSGAGHFVRMAQGLMERSMMQSFSQGVEFFGNWQGTSQMNPAALEKVWRHGSDVSNELQQLAEAYLAQSAEQAANPLPTPAITLARSLSFAASGAKMYMQGLEALLKQRGTGQ